MRSAPRSADPAPPTLLANVDPGDLPGGWSPSALAYLRVLQADNAQLREELRIAKVERNLLQSRLSDLSGQRAEHRAVVKR